MSRRKRRRLRIIYEAAPLLNSRLVDFLADLFLARYEFDRRSLPYRRYKAAMITASFDFGCFYASMLAAAKLFKITVEDLLFEIVYLTELQPTPMDETFNKYYRAPDLKGIMRLTMRSDLPPLGKFQFLAATFMIIILENYPVYEGMRKLYNSKKISNSYSSTFCSYKSIN